jgi:hypothetical protein
MSLLEDAHKSFKGLVGYEPTDQERLAEQYALRSGVTLTQQAQAQAQPSINTGGVMNASVQSPVNQSAMELAMENEAYGAPRQEGWKLGDTYTRLSSLYGANVQSIPRLLGTPSTWKEFGDQASKTFKELGYKVDKKRLFPIPVHLDASEGRNIPLGDSTQGRDYHEQQWLEKSRLDSLHPIHKKIAQSDPGWELRSDGGINSYGLFYGSIDSDKYPNAPIYNDNSYLGISTIGSTESRGTPEITETFGGGAPDFKSSTITTKAVPPIRSTPWHEYGHYLDQWLGSLGASGGKNSLSDIAMSLNYPKHEANPQLEVTAQDHYEAWMTDDRTAHLDVVDKINTVDHPNQKLNNPREILGKLFATAMANPKRTDGAFFDPDPFHRNNMEENIARAIGTYFNPDAQYDEGHIQGIKDMRSDVIGAIANLLNQ